MPAAHPGEDHPVVARLDMADSARPAFQHPADDLMPHRQGQGHAAIGHPQLAAAAHVVHALPDVQIGVADAGMGDFEQHLVAGRLRRRQFDFLQRFPVLDNGPGAHDRVSFTSKNFAIAACGEAMLGASA